jgi:hypothetical protein
MNWFLHSMVLPGCIFAIGLGLALWTGKVIDLRRSSYSSASLWLNRSDSPFYYWLFVGTLGVGLALCAWDAIMR